MGLFPERIQLEHSSSLVFFCKLGNLFLSFMHRRSKLLFFSGLLADPFPPLVHKSCPPLSSSFFDFEDRLVYRRNMLVRRSDRKTPALERIRRKFQEELEIIFHHTAPFSHSYLKVPSYLGIETTSFHSK